MNKEEELYKLFKNMYGTTFNRTLTIGTVDKGYNTYQINNIEELCNYFEKYHNKNELYISLYSYESTEEVIMWNKLNDLDKFQKNAIKNCIVFRLKNKSEDINEELRSLTPVKYFTFIRRLINLGYDKKIVKESKLLYDAINNLFKVKPTLIFNGFDECLCYLYFEPLKLENSMLTFYYFIKFIENYVDIKTLNYKEIEPFSQIISLPGSQNNLSRLYVHSYNYDDEYLSIIKKCESPNIPNTEIKLNQDTKVLEELLVTLDQEITKKKSENQLYSTLDYDLDDLFKL